jgi:uncharacterized protein involved in type VI secretion and phage assembly
MANSSLFPGVYRGIVLNNLDPEQLGRLELQVPSVKALAAGTWAPRCAPLAGSQKGAYFTPAVGDEVLVAFESGDVNFPIVLGYLWNGTQQPPAEAVGPPPDGVIEIKSRAQHAILIRDTPGPLGGVEIHSAGGAMISVNDVAITITNGKGAAIVLQGPSVVVNGKPLPT